MCRIIIHKSTLNFNHSFFYNNVPWSRVLPDLLNIPESQITMVVIVLIACVCMASVALEGGRGALSLLQAGWGGGGGGACASGAPLLPPPMYPVCMWLVYNNAML